MLAGTLSMRASIEENGSHGHEISILREQKLRRFDADNDTPFFSTHSVRTYHGGKLISYYIYPSSLLLQGNTAYSLELR